MSTYSKLCRRLAPAFPALAAFFLLLPGATAAQTCTPGTSVSVDLVRDANGDPVIEPDDEDRLELIHVSSGLEDALGLDFTPGADVNPQIRVVVEDPALPNGMLSSAIFTVGAVFTDEALKIEIFDQEEPGDEDSGYFKLFEDATSVDFASVEATVYAVAPSSTTTAENGGSPATAQHFCEPGGNGTYGFVENVKIETDKRFVLLVPHGGEIEQGTSEQIDAVAGVLDASYSIDANVWETAGDWHDDVSEHWHIGSGAIDAASFPGLADLRSRTDYGTGLEFQYAASLHGFGSYEGNGLVLGGRAHREAKCLVARRIQQRLAAEGRGEIAYYIWDLDGDDTNNIDLPDEREVKITDERPDVGLKGTDPDNIVNRLSANASGDAGFGGIQIEESRPLRDDTAIRNLVAEEIAHAFGEMITDPSIIDDANPTLCAALVASSQPPPGDAEVGDRVWIDEDADGLQDAGEPGLAGVTVELFSFVGVPQASTVTDAQGNYLFEELHAGDYYLRFTPPPGYGAADQVAGFPDLDSDADKQTRETAAFTLGESDSDLSLDAGFRSDCFDVALVAFASEWRTANAFEDGWYEPSFADGEWDELQGSLGWGTSSAFSTLPDTALTSYFRLSFDVEDPTLFDALDLFLFRDDGAVVYLNGVEVMRSNMPAGTVDEDTPAASHSKAYDAGFAPASLLQTGPNVLAVEVHNRSQPPGGDLVFDLEVRAAVCRSCLAEALLEAGAGTFLEAAAQGAVNGGEDELKIDGPSEESAALLSWSVAGLPADAEVLHAEVVFEVTDGSGDTFRLYPLLREWDESAANWNVAAPSSPAVAWETPGAKGTSDRDAGRPLGLLAFDDDPMTGITVLNVSGRGLVQGWIGGSEDNFGVVIPGDEGQDNDLGFEADGEDSPPVLRVVYASGCGG